MIMTVEYDHYLDTVGCSVLLNCSMLSMQFYCLCIGVQSAGILADSLQDRNYSNCDPIVPAERRSNLKFKISC